MGVTILIRNICKYPVKSKLECLQITIDELQQIQQDLSTKYHRKNNLRYQHLNACRGIKKCNMALFRTTRMFDGICSQLRSSIFPNLQSELDAFLFEEEFFDNSEFNEENNGIYQIEEQGNHFTYRKFYNESGICSHLKIGRNGYNRSGHFNQAQLQECDNYRG